MKKMISASIALLVMEEPHVGPTVVTLILSSGVWGTVFVGDVVLVVVATAAAVAPALAVVEVVGLAVVEVVVVGDGVGAWAAVRSVIAFSTFLLTASCWSCDRWLRSDCTLSVCLLPLPSSSTVGSMMPVPFRALVAWVWETPGAAMVHSVPPLNSIPRFRPPRNTMEMIPSTMIAVEIPNQIRRLPTKSKRVSPR